MSILANVIEFAHRSNRTGERGAAATEYGLLVTFIAIALVGAVFLFGQSLGAMFQDFVTAVAGF